jgi:predicted lipid-binding transport protein (Tim44 family)
MGLAGWYAGQLLGGRSRRPLANGADLQGQRMPCPGVPAPDRIRSPAEVAGKAERTLRLLEYLAASDSTFELPALSAMVEDVFTRVQLCWQLRDYSSVKDLLSPSLLAQHEELLTEMGRNREVNKIDDLAIQRLEFIHFFQSDRCAELTALVTFQAKVYFVDERSGAYLRGAREAMLYQEFWTFQRSPGGWRLLQILPSSDSDRLVAANRVAGMTEAGVESIERRNNG